ncbi:MAG: hypothetical protein ACR2MO_13405 [Acidimicrobiales bacterium]
MHEHTLVIKPLVRLLWVAASSGTLLLAVLDRSPELLVLFGMTGLALVASIRGRAVLRDGVVYRRGLFGWIKDPVLLEEVAKISLRRDTRSRYFPRNTGTS